MAVPYNGLDVLTENFRNGRHSAREFNPPTTERSQSVYACEEVRFLWVAIQCVRREDDKCPMSFNDDQRAALLDLDDHLCARELRKKPAIDALYTAFRVLYFPSDTTPLVTNMFASPLVVFMALLWQRHDGYTSIFLVPPKYVMIQSSMRLRGHHLAVEQLDVILNECLDPGERGVRVVRGRIVETDSDDSDSDSDSHDSDCLPSNVRAGTKRTRDLVASLKLSRGQRWFEYVDG